MTSGAGDVHALLAREIERRLALFESGAPAEGDLRAALHSLKGSAAMGGFQDLALIIAQLSAKIRSGDTGAVEQAARILRTSAARLHGGLEPFSSRWPEPPPVLGPSAVDPRYRVEYLAAIADRLRELDAALGNVDAATQALEQAYRGVHAMKGAAGSVGDDTMAWYCHGLEAWLKRPRSEEQAREALLELARHRAILALFAEDAARALERLRTMAARRSTPLATPPPGLLRPPSQQPQKHSSRPPPFENPAQGDDVLMRVSPRAVDMFLERLERVELVRDELKTAAEVARQVGGRLRDLRASLLEALRLIGPPRPWGAPAAALQRVEAAARTLGAAADHAERGALLCRRNAEVIHVRAGEMRRDVAGLRRTSLSWLFVRVEAAVERFAAGEGRAARVECSGADLSIDRRVAERLIDTVIQLARNAVAHGILPPEKRLAKGKQPVGTVALRAERLGDWLRIVVEDDGEGVDVERIRQQAVERGVLTPEAAQSMHQDELLALLFLPGFTTQEGADLLAGRGVGLDLAQDVVRRLGGSIRIASRPGSGLTATVDVPSERGLVDVLWLRSGAFEFALPVGFTGRLEPAPTALPFAPLSSCLGLPGSHPPALGLELRLIGVEPIAIGVDDVGEVEETAIRAVPALVAAAGPYSGAVLRGDGSLRLALDPALLAARAWSHSGPA